MDFVAIPLFDDRVFRSLTMLDNYSSNYLRILVGQSKKREQAAHFIDYL